MNTKQIDFDPLIDKIARNIFKNPQYSYDWDDYMQIGRMHAFQAYERYRGTEFIKPIYDGSNGLKKYIVDCLNYRFKDLFMNMLRKRASTIRSYKNVDGNKKYTTVDELIKSQTREISFESGNDIDLSEILNSEEADSLDLIDLKMFLSKKYPTWYEDFKSANKTIYELNQKINNDPKNKELKEQKTKINKELSKCEKKLKKIVEKYKNE